MLCFCIIFSLLFSRILYFRLKCKNIIRFPFDKTPWQNVYNVNSVIVLSDKRASRHGALCRRKHVFRREFPIDTLGEAIPFGLWCDG